MCKLISRSIWAALAVAVTATPALGQADKSAPPAAGQAVKSTTEFELIAVLKSDASVKEKADACRQLASVGTRAAVPALAALLADERLTHMARYGLEPIPDPSVDEALRAVLGQLKGRPLVGVIGSMGVRRDAKAIEPLTERLKDADPDVAQAAARSLGRIGTPEAGRALMRTLATNPPAGNQPALYEGLFRCAETLSTKGAREEAQVIYDLLRGGKRPHQVETGAVRGAILVMRSKDGLDLLRQQLRSEDRALFTAAVRTAQEMKDPEVAAMLVAELKQLPTDRRGMVIQSLACVADRCLRGKDAAQAAGRLIDPLQQATELSASAALRQQTQALLQEARKIADKK